MIFYLSIFVHTTTQSSAKLNRAGGVTLHEALAENNLQLKMGHCVGRIGLNADQKVAFDVLHCYVLDRCAALIRSV